MRMMDRGFGVGGVGFYRWVTRLCEHKHLHQRFFEAIWQLYIHKVAIHLANLIFPVISMGRMRH